MKTLAERIADKNKTPLYAPFVDALHEIAINEGLPVDIVWQRWEQYTKDCRNYDQSPVLSEFCTWNNFEQVNIA